MKKLRFRLPFIRKSSEFNLQVVFSLESSLQAVLSLEFTPTVREGKTA